MDGAGPAAPATSAATPPGSAWFSDPSWRPWRLSSALTCRADGRRPRPRDRFSYAAALAAHAVAVAKSSSARIFSAARSSAVRAPYLRRRSL